MNLFESHRIIASNLKWIAVQFIDTAARKAYALIIFWTFLAVLFELLTPWCIGKIVEAIISPTSAITTGIALLGVVSVAHILADWRTSQSKEFFIGQAFRGMFVGIVTEFFRKDIALHERESELLSNAVIDKGIQRIDNILHLATFWTVHAILILVVTLPMLAHYSLVASAIALALLVTSLLYSSIINRKVLTDNEPVEEEIRTLFTENEDLRENVTRVMMCAQEDAVAQDFAARFDAWLDKDRQIWMRFNTRNVPRRLFVAGGLVLVTYLAGILAEQGELTTGEFISIATWIAVATGQIYSIINLERQLTWAQPPLAKLRAVFALQRTINNGPNAMDLPANGPAKIELENVCFAYPGGAPILTKVSILANPGDVLGLVGKTGCGKSTIISLILGKIRPTAGRVLIDGRDLQEDVTLGSWREQCAYIPQHPELLHRSVRKNLEFGLTKAEIARLTDDDLWSALRRFQADFGERLKDGLETKVGKGGVELSGGERQRLIIAAASLRRNARLLILDEATSALDAHIQAQVQREIYRLAKERGMTVIMIAHRLSTLRGCTKLAFVRNGDRKEGQPQIAAVASTLDDLGTHVPEFRHMLALEHQQLTA